MNITVKFSNSILMIYKEISELETLVMEEPATVNDILIKLGVSPVLAPLILIDSQRVGRNHIVNNEEMITVIGPLAGG